jgi:hypothetical protein
MTLQASVSVGRPAALAAILIPGLSAVHVERGLEALAAANDESFTGVAGMLLCPCNLHPVRNEQKRALTMTS